MFSFSGIIILLKCILLYAIVRFWMLATKQFQHPCWCFDVYLLFYVEIKQSVAAVLRRLSIRSFCVDIKRMVLVGLAYTPKICFQFIRCWKAISLSPTNNIVVLFVINSLLLLILLKIIVIFVQKRRRKHHNMLLYTSCTVHKVTYSAYVCIQSTVVLHNVSLGAKYRQSIHMLYRYREI